MASNQRYRLVTRSDFDGLVCAVLLKEMDLIEDILFVHPKDMQDGKVEITENDITTNLPYNSRCHLAFDHHLSEALRRGAARPKNYILDPIAPSTARVVYNHYGGRETFARLSDDLLVAVDKGDAAWFTLEEVVAPRGWALLNFLMDARTGLGRFRNFRVSNYELMMQLIDYCRMHDVDEILDLPDVAERVTLYQEHSEKAKHQIQRCSKIHGNAVVLDYRKEETIYACNRFLVYAMYPECNLSIHVLWGKQRRNVAFAMGNSIFNTTSATNIGELAMEYGGGGHENAGTCQVETERAGVVLAELLGRIFANERGSKGDPASAEGATARTTS